MFYPVKKIDLLIIICFALISNGCKYSSVAKNKINFNNPFTDHVLNDPTDYYYFDFKKNSGISSGLPIGMFDSGTGGLTVLNAVVNLDQYDNSNHEYISAGDGIRDFNTEQFIYFGDQANMPYGHYAEVNKTEYLKELILRDALFLLGNKYYRTPDDIAFQTDKQTVKLIVIACNTATAYGKSDIEEMISSAGSKIKVIGVIDAGVRGALSTFKKNESGTIAVMATAGTVSSDGYLNTFNKLSCSNGYTGDIEFIQHPGIGIAEAIDEEPNYIARNASGPGNNYKGPSLNYNDLKIKKELLNIYSFDTTGNFLLVDAEDGEYKTIQLNSPENYVKFHLVSLCETLLEKKDIKPLKTLILGCTHYPYLSEYIHKSLKELYNLKISNKYVYRHVLCDSVILIDPAVNTAKEIYKYLFENKLLNKKGNISRSEFYISVPDNLNPEIKIDSMNWFIYDYKYGRNNGTPYDTKQVPVSRLNTGNEIIQRLKKQIPDIYGIIKTFNAVNSKTSFLKPEERF